MKLEDYVRKSIWQYPSLYKDVDYEKSEMKVLDHVFFTCGNGLELAQTEDPTQGGFYVSPTMKRVKGEWERLPDKAYGVEKFRKLPKDYFKYPVYYVSQGNGGRDASESAYIVKNELYGQDSVYIRIHQEIELNASLEKETTLESLFRGPRLVEAESRHPFRPYPISVDYSAFGDLKNGAFLQPDWMDGLVRVSRAALEYYLDPERTKTEHSHPSFTVPSCIKDFEKAASEGPESVMKLKKQLWGWEKNPTSDVPTEAEIRQWRQDLFDDAIGERVKILNDFLSKHP